MALTKKVEPETYGRDLLGFMEKKEGHSEFRRDSKRCPESFYGSSQKFLTQYEDRSWKYSLEGLWRDQN